MDFCFKVRSCSLKILIGILQSLVGGSFVPYVPRTQAIAPETRGITLRANISLTPSLTSVHLPVTNRSRQAQPSELIKPIVK